VIKNGPINAYTETPVFEHLSTLGGVVTQWHFPSYYMDGSGPAPHCGDAILSFYIDGETEASLKFTPNEAAGIGISPDSNENTDQSPWGINEFGHTASGGGIYSTVRIPFSKSIRVTIEMSAEDSAMGNAIFWFIIRGIENYPIILGDLQLPSPVRLRLYRNINMSLPMNSFYTVANITGTSGALFMINFSGMWSNYGYLEGCLRAFIDGSTNATFLSSGVEDYFLSSSYFNEGQFKTPESGVTFFNSAGSVSAYKLHTRDPILFSPGLDLVWQVGSTDCPSTWPPNENNAQSGYTWTDDNITISTLCWVYEYQLTDNN